MVDQLFNMDINGEIVSSFEVKKIFNQAKINKVSLGLAEGTAIGANDIYFMSNILSKDEKNI